MKHTYRAVVLCAAACIVTAVLTALACFLIWCYAGVPKLPEEAVPAEVSVRVRYASKREDTARTFSESKDLEPIAQALRLLTPYRRMRADLYAGQPETTVTLRYREDGEYAYRFIGGGQVFISHDGETRLYQYSKEKSDAFLQLIWERCGTD